jgi:hypothetical protein
MLLQRKTHPAKKDTGSGRGIGICTNKTSLRSGADLHDEAGHAWNQVARPSRYRRVDQHRETRWIAHVLIWNATPHGIPNITAAISDAAAHTPRVASARSRLPGQLCRATTNCRDGGPLASLQPHAGTAKLTCTCSHARVRRPSSRALRAT